MFSHVRAPVATGAFSLLTRPNPIVEELPVGRFDPPDASSDLV